MKYKRIKLDLIILILFVLFVFVLPKIINNKTTMYDIYKKENLPFKVNGRVTDIELYKGGAVTLTIREESKNRKQIAVSSEFKNIVKNGDWFEKEENTNKCLIKRNDSVIFLDCYQEIPKELRDSFKIKEWPENIKGKWLPLEYIDKEK